MDNRPSEPRRVGAFAFLQLPPQRVVAGRLIDTSSASVVARLLLRSFLPSTRSPSESGRLFSTRQRKEEIRCLTVNEKDVGSPEWTKSAGKKSRGWAAGPHIKRAPRTNSPRRKLARRGERADAPSARTANTCRPSGEKAESLARRATRGGRRSSWARYTRRRWARRATVGERRAKKRPATAANSSRREMPALADEPAGAEASSFPALLRGFPRPSFGRRGRRSLVAGSLLLRSSSCHRTS